MLPVPFPGTHKCLPLVAIFRPFVSLSRVRQGWSPDLPVPGISFIFKASRSVAVLVEETINGKRLRSQSGVLS